jgi:hypothetical protein
VGSMTRPERLPSPWNVPAFLGSQIVPVAGGVPKCARTICLAHEVRKQSEHRLIKRVILKESPLVVLWRIAHCSAQLIEFAWASVDALTMAVTGLDDGETAGRPGSMPPGLWSIVHQPQPSR